MSVMNKKSNTSFLLKYPLYLKMFVLRGRWGGCPQRAGVESRGDWLSVGGGTGGRPGSPRGCGRSQQSEEVTPTVGWRVLRWVREYPSVGMNQRGNLSANRASSQGRGQGRWCEFGIHQGTKQVHILVYTSWYTSNKYVLTVMRARVLALREWSCKHGEGEPGCAFRIGIRSYHCELMDCNVCISIWHQCWYINIRYKCVHVCVCTRSPPLST